MPNNKDKRITLSLRPDELRLITNALDSHAYWQLSEVKHRRGGTVVGDSAEKPEVRQCYSLKGALEALTPSTEDKLFRVSWVIEVYASSPELAVREARRAQRPGTSARFFEVRREGNTGPTVKIELPEEEGLESLPMLLATASDMLEKLNEDPDAFGESMVSGVVDHLKAMAEHLECLEEQPAVVEEKSEGAPT